MSTSVDQPRIGISVFRGLATACAAYALIFALHDALIWIFRASPIRMVIQPASSIVYSPHHFIEAIVRCLMIGVAMLTAWRGRGKSSRLLTWALIWSSMDVYWQWYAPAGLFLWLPMVSKYLGTSLGLLYFIRFAARFGDGDYHGIRALIYRLSPAVLLVGIIGFFAQFVLLPINVNLIYALDPAYDPSKANVAPLFDAYLISYALAKLAMLVAAGIGYLQSPLPQKQATLIVLFAFFAYASATAFHFLFRLAYLKEPQWLNYTDAIGFACLALGLAVALFWRHQVFDVEFVLDRALAASVVGGVLLLLYYSADHLYADIAARNLANVLGQSAPDDPAKIKLLLEIFFGFIFFLGFHKLYTMAEPVVEHLFFPEREKRLAVLEDFEGKIALINNVDELRRRLFKVIERGTQAEFVSVFTRDGDRGYRAVMSTGIDSPAPVSASDEGVLWMKDGKHVHLSDVTSAIPGVLALPMPVSGKLYGFLACGPTPGEKRYAALEVRALAAIAREAGATLFAIRTHRELIS